MPGAFLSHENIRAIGGEFGQQHIFYAGKMAENPNQNPHMCYKTYHHHMFNSTQKHVYMCKNIFVYIVYICTYKNHRNHFCIKICIIETRK